MRSRQGGYAGLIVLLLALVVVAMLSKTLLGQMGLLGGGTTTAAAKPNPAATSRAQFEDAAATPPATALERARGLEQAVQEQARENAERIDKATQ